MQADAIFSVDHLPRDQRFGLWRENMAPFFDVSRDRCREEPFQGELRVRKLGDVLLAHTATSRQSWQRSAVTIARTGTDRIMLQAYLKGTQQVSFQGGSLDMPEGGLLVYDLSQEMRAESTDLANLSLILPRAMLEELLPRVGDYHMCPLPGSLPVVAQLRRLMIDLWRMPRGKNAETGTSAVPEMVAAALRAGKGAEEGLSQFSDPSLLVILRRHVESRLTDPTLAPDDMARRLGLSRSRIYEIFAPYHGVAAYIRERRLRAARRTIMDPASRHLSIGAIARMFCFNHSDFSRAFLARFGLSPRAARYYAVEDRDMGIGRWRNPPYEMWLRAFAA